LSDIYVRQTNGGVDMAVHFQYFHDVNAYVEEQSKYLSDIVMIQLDDATFRVSAYPVDEAHAVISGASPIVDNTLADLNSALKFYSELAHQLSQGDVIRNLSLNGVAVRNSYNSNNSRY
jgi:hypothetical protein